MQPHNRTPHVEQPLVQPVPVPQVDGRHADAPPPVVAAVVLLDRPAPVLAHLLRAVLVEADVDQEVAVVRVRLEVRRGFVGRPLLDRGGEQGRGVPAVELAGALGFVVEGGAERDDSCDLYVISPFAQGDV